jgi:hypothetical protein
MTVSSATVGWASAQIDGQRDQGGSEAAMVHTWEWLHKSRADHP